MLLRLACLQLRLNKVSELIHNSAIHRNLEMARVSVYFQEIVDTVRAPAACWLQCAYWGIVTDTCCLQTGQAALNGLYVIKIVALCGLRRPPRKMLWAFQGEDESEVVPGSDFVVARTALRSNASNYYVDGRKSSFGEVTDLLKAKGVDLDNNRFLILQARCSAQLSSFAAPSLTMQACAIV